MKSFLVRLAQRSIGQVPVVRSRTMPAPPIVGAGGGAAALDAPVPPAVATGGQPSLMAAAVHVAGELPPTIPQTAVAPPVTPPPAEIHAIQTTRVITEVVERLSPEPPAALIEREGQEVRPPADVMTQPASVAAPIQPAVTPAIQPAVPPPIVAPDPAAPAPTQTPTPITTYGGTTPATDRGPAIQPTPIAFIKPRHEPPAAPEPVNPTAVLTPAGRERPALPGPHAAPPVPPSAKAPPPSEERIVQVRIGAIEIHAPVPQPAPPPAAAAIERTLARGGFDEFARLRSYAPWEW